jgi:hypothetical protein
MEKNKKPGLRIDAVHLLNSCISTQSIGDELEYNLAVTSIDRKEISQEELRVVVSFDLMKGIEKPPFNFTASYGIRYTRDPDAPMTWNDLTNGFVLTHILPYFREFASSVTLRLPVPALIIPPTNVNLLLKEYEASLKSVPVAE